MRFFVIQDDKYIYAVGKGIMGEEINEGRYFLVLDALSTKPQETETIGYHLKTDLTWEPYEIEPIPEPTEIDDSEALNIILGGAS